MGVYFIISTWKYVPENAPLEHMEAVRFVTKSCKGVSMRNTFQKRKKYKAKRVGFAGPGSGL